jgi:hypothetical protein
MKKAGGALCTTSLSVLIQPENLSWKKEVKKKGGRPYVLHFRHGKMVSQPAQCQT